MAPTAAKPLLLVPLLCCLLSLAAGALAATTESPALTPLSLGGDRLVFHGRKASATWRAAAKDEGAVSGAAAATPAPDAAQVVNSTLGLRFGRLAELNHTTGEVVRRVPSLARLTPSQMTTGTKTGTNGTLDFVLLAYDGAALNLTACPTAPAADATPAAVAAAEALAAAAKAAAAKAAVEIEVLLASGGDAAAPVALPYANETVVVPSEGFKWSIDVQRWPFCGANNTLAFDVVLRGVDTYDAAPRVYDGRGNATHGSSSVAFGDGLYVPGGLGGVLGGAGDGDNEDADEAVEAEEKGGAQAAGSSDGGACAAALRGLANVTDGTAGEARALAPAWFMPNVLTPYLAVDPVVSWVGSEGSSSGSPPSSPPPSPSSSPAPTRRSLLEAEAGGDDAKKDEDKKDDDDDQKHKPKFNCSERAEKQRQRIAEAAAARLAAIDAEAAAILANGSASASTSALAAAAASSGSATSSPSSISRKLLRELNDEKAGDDGKAADAADADNDKRVSRASSVGSGRISTGTTRVRPTRVTAAAAAAAAASAQRAREEGAAAAAARANAAVAAQTAAMAAKDACNSTSALLAAKRALGLPRIRARARPGTPLGDAFAAADAAATAAAATSGAAVAAAADVAGDVLCPASINALSAKVANASALGGGNGRVRARAPERGRLATMLLSQGVAAKLDLPAFAVDGDPSDPAALQLPVDVLVLPDAEDAASTVTRYLFPQPSSASARLHYDPTTSAAPAADAYSSAEIQDAAAAPVPTFDGAFMMDAMATGTGEGAGAGDAAGGKAKSGAAGMVASASATTATAVAGAGLLLLLLV